MPNYQVQSHSQSSPSDSSAEEAVLPEAQQPGNQQIIDIIRSQNNPTGPRALDPNKNGIVLLGLNTYANDEARALNRFNRGSGGARSAVPQQKQDHIRRGSVEYDLRTEAGAASYIATLGLPNQLAIRAAQLLASAGEEAKDELAQFIRILSEAEMGERKIDRMVLSGHSVGSQIWGDENGTINFTEIADLAKMFPAAMGQVQHLFMSACYSGGERTMQRYKEMFQGVSSIWAYHGSSPGTWSGAIGHLEQWEKATETGKDPGNVDPSLAQGIRKAENVSTWNSVDGYQGDKPMKIAELERLLQEREAMFQSHYSGETLVADSQSGPLRNYYALVQQTISHADVNAELAEWMSLRRDVTIRLLYYTLISSKFQEHYHSILKRDYDSCGTSLPDFSQLNRLEAMEHIEANEGALAGTEALSLLQRGLRNLSEEVIPTGWV